MKQCMDADNLHRRLKKIIGQVQTIDRMVDEDVPCEDILAQINAAKSALHGCGKVVLEGHIKHCVRDGIEHGDADKTIENFTKAVERFSNMGWAGDKPSHALVFSRIARKKRSSFVLLLSFCALYSLHPHMYNKPIPPMVQKVVTSVKLAMEKLKHFLELGGTKKDIALLVISGVALIVSIFDLVPLPFDASWAAIILCGIPIILEAVIGLVTAFDIKANVLVSLALIASVCIGEDFAAGIEKLVHLTPQTARVILGGKETAVPAEAVKVGIAMGGVGSDIAVDAADIALVDDEVTELPHLIALSKRMMRTIKLNITFSLMLNFIAIVLAITDTLNPVVGALVHKLGPAAKMEANRLAEFRVRRREICLIVNSDDRRVGIYSLRGACVAAALRAARHEAQRILFKKSGLQNCDPPFLIFFYFLRQTEGIKRTSSGMISRRPSSMMALIVSLLMPERKPKLHVGPTAPRPGPTLLMAVSEAVKAAVKSMLSSDKISVPSSMIAI